MAKYRVIIALCIFTYINSVVCSICQDTCECFGNVVDCSEKELKEIPMNLPEWVEDLNLSKNPGLFIQNDSFTTLPDLVSLSLDRMKLDELPDLSELKTLKRLSLNDNKISVISFAWLQTFPSLVELELGKNRLTTLHPGDWNHSKLKKLDVGSNDISVISSDSTFNLPSLSSLRLSRNDINAEAFRNLSYACASLPSLKTLDLNRNSIQTLQGLMFQHLVNVTVKSLKLRRNKLLHLPDGAFYGLQSLTTLNLDHNENITEITNGWLFGLKSLKVLTISHNKVHSIKEASWKEARQLEILDVSFNELGCQHTEPSFSGLHNLKKLYVSNNCLANLDSNTFEQMSNLNELDLSYNQIQWSIEDSSGTFKGLSNLETLKLSHNKIETVHDRVFSDLNSLIRLDLSGNNLKTLSQNPFRILPRLKTLNLNTTSLVCNCHLVWLPTWLKTQKFDKVKASCGYPEDVKGRSIFELSVNNFSCSVSPEPTIIEYPKNGTVLFGDNVTMQCVARTSGDEPIFMWSKDRQYQAPFMVETYMSVEEDSPDGTPVYRVVSKFKINNVTLENSGQYQCVARNSFGPSYSDLAKITVHRFPYFTKVPVSVEVKTGKSAELNCAAEGFPTPEISWKKEGEPFHAASERRLHFLSDEESSIINPIRAIDDGTYICTAKNEAGQINATLRITVIQAPKFSRALSNRVADLDQSTVLECEGSGKPKPTVTWMKDGHHILSSENHVLLDDGQFLLFMKVLKSDEGLYSCELTNTLGTLRRNMTLTIAQQLSTVAMWQAIVFAAICVFTTCLIWVAILYCTRHKMSTSENKQSPKEPIYVTQLNGKPREKKHSLHNEAHKTTPLLSVAPNLEPFTTSTQDSSSEHSSGKDSGVGDTIHRSSEDLRKNAVEFRSNLRKNMYQMDTTLSTKSTVENDDMKPRLSTFGYFDSSKGPNATYASLRRGSASRLLPVPSPVMPRNGMSSLPRQAYRSHSSSLSQHKSRKCNTTARTHRAPTPPLFYSKDSWKEDDGVESQELRHFGSVSRINNQPLPNFYSDPNSHYVRKKKSLDNGQSFYLPSR